MIEVTTPIVLDGRCHAIILHAGNGIEYLPPRTVILPGDVSAESIDLAISLLPSRHYFSRDGYVEVVGQRAGRHDYLHEIELHAKPHEIVATLPARLPAFMAWQD